MRDVHGDVALAARLRAALGSRHDIAAVAAVSAGEVRLAGLGAGPEADFELGSISKALTGLLHAEALARGEVTASTTLGELLPLAGTAAGGVALAALSTHRSGLPRLPRSAGVVRRSFALWLRGANPYGDDVETLLDQARGTPVGRPRPRYSNLGFELLGHALARAAGTGFAELVERRIASPLALQTLYAPAEPAELRPDALIGRSRSGRRQEPWTGEAIAPAGGPRASIGDMALLVRAILDGTAPGMAALEPVARFLGPVRIGAGWFTSTHDGREITWHNGGTGGFRSWVGLDRSSRTGLVLLTATAIGVDAPGARMLSEVPASRS